MNILSHLLIWLFGGFAEFLARFFGKKVAVGTAAVVAFSTLTTSILAFSGTVISTLIPSMPGGQYVSLALWLVVPDNGPAVVAACISADAAIAVYKWNVSNLNLINQA